MFKYIKKRRTGIIAPIKKTRAFFLFDNASNKKNTGNKIIKFCLDRNENAQKIPEINKEKKLFFLNSAWKKYTDITPNKIPSMVCHAIAGKLCNEKNKKIAVNAKTKSSEINSDSISIFALIYEVRIIWKIENNLSKTKP